MKFTLFSAIVFLFSLTTSLFGLNDAETELEWWKQNNLRVIQTNLPAYEAGLDPDALVDKLEQFCANVLIINAGGIMAFYPSELPFQYKNPYMKEEMLGKVIERCHKAGIKVITRFDFSRIHKSIFEQHQDWAYISPSNERMINEDMYVVSINAPYVQQKSLEIVDEVITKYDIDGIFINMPGYLTWNYYQDQYLGIDQNQHDQKRFADFTGGLSLPVKEDESDELFQKYQQFKSYTVDDWLIRLRKMIKSKDESIAICTYCTDHVDIIRHESVTKKTPYWPYNSTDNIKNTIGSHPDKIVSNASIQQISFKSRFNAVEPEEVAIRLYENIANGSGLDVSFMGDFEGYEDERNFEIIEDIYSFHQKWESYFGDYSSPAEIAVISPGYWPGGDPMMEYRGLQLMLNEAHIQYDIIEKSQISKLEESLKKYRLVILPDSNYLDDEALRVLRRLLESGVNLLATNRAFTAHQDQLSEFFGATIDTLEDNCRGNYIAPDNKTLFKSMEQQAMLYMEDNLGIYKFDSENITSLPILAKGIPGPPEKTGGHIPIGRFALSIKDHKSSRAAVLPCNLGKLYYLKGYEQHKNIVLDVIRYLHPEVDDLLTTNAHPRVETILQNYRLNDDRSQTNGTFDGRILHLVNLTGFSGNTFFSPIPIHQIRFKIKQKIRPSKVFSLVNEAPVEYEWKDGTLSFTVDCLDKFDGIVISYNP